MKTFTPRDIVAIGLVSTALGLFTWGSMRLMKVCKEEDKQLFTCSQLIQKCNKIAAGADGVFEVEEGYNLARGVGYEGPILSGERVVLEPWGLNSPIAELKIGRLNSSLDYRVSFTIPAKNMQDYLARVNQ